MGLAFIICGLLLLVTGHPFLGMAVILMAAFHTSPRR